MFHNAGEGQMNTRSHIHEIELTETPEEVFSLLLTPSAMREWWSAARAIVIPNEGGIWAAAWGGDEVGAIRSKGYAGILQGDRYELCTSIGRRAYDQAGGL